MGALATSANFITKVPKESRFERVIVVGAGLSKAFGLPLANELLPVALAHASSAGLKTNILEKFVADFYPAADPDVEDLLGMAEAAVHYISLRAMNLRGNRWRPKAIEDAVYQLRRAISSYFWSVQSTISSETLAPLTAFVRSLGGSRTAYVSFNYDLLLEAALEFAGVSFSYHMPSPPNGAVLIKPHGSVNWYDVEPKLISVRSIGLPTLKMFAASDFFQDMGRVGLPAGFIVPPSPQKTIGNEFLRKIWTTFSSLVTNTKTLSIIGYSMPTADRLARLVLRRSGSGFSNTRQISVINPAPDAETHFKRLIDPKVFYLQAAFEQFAPQLAKHRNLFAI